MKKGMILAALHVALILTIGAQFAFDRATAPRGWMRTMPYDPNTPLRGRYVTMQVLAKIDSEFPAAKRDMGGYDFDRSVALFVQDNQVWARSIDNRSGQLIGRIDKNEVELQSRVDFFIPEHIADPSLVKPDEELWVEVTIPPSGPPRPIRLEVRKKPAPSPQPLQ